MPELVRLIMPPAVCELAAVCFHKLAAACFVEQQLSGSPAAALTCDACQGACTGMLQHVSCTCWSRISSLCDACRATGNPCQAAIAEAFLTMLDDNEIEAVIYPVHDSSAPYIGQWTYGDPFGAACLHVCLPSLHSLWAALCALFTAPAEVQYTCWPAV